MRLEIKEFEGKKCMRAVINGGEPYLVVSNPETLPFGENVFDGRALFDQNTGLATFRGLNKHWIDLRSRIKNRDKLLREKKTIFHPQTGERKSEIMEKVDNELYSGNEDLIDILIDMLGLCNFIAANRGHYEEPPELEIIKYEPEPIDFYGMEKEPWLTKPSNRKHYKIYYDED